MKTLFRLLVAGFTLAAVFGIIGMMAGAVAGLDSIRSAGF